MLQAFSKNSNGPSKIARWKIPFQGCGANDLVVQFDGCAGWGRSDLEGLAETREDEENAMNAKRQMRNGEWGDMGLAHVFVYYIVIFLDNTQRRATEEATPVTTTGTNQED